VTVAHVRRFPLASVLAGVFGLLLGGAVLAVLTAGISSGFHSTRALLADRAVLLVDSVTERAREHVDAARFQAEFVAARLAAGAVDPVDRDALAEILVASLAAAPQLASVVFVDGGLQGIEVERVDAKVRVADVDWDEVEGAVQGLRELRRARSGFWGDLIYRPEIGDAVLNYRAPARRGGVLLGAVVTTVATRELSGYLSNLTRGREATAFVLVGPDQVLAHPGLASGGARRGPDEPLPGVTAVGDPVLARIWDEDARRRVPFMDGHPGYEAHVVALTGERHVFVYQRLYGIGPIPWIVGCYFPAESLRAAFGDLLWAALAGLAVLVVSILAVRFLARRVAAPVLRLASAAERVRGEGPDAVEPLPPSALTELDAANRAFNEMVEGLRHRERLRRTFGRYVPSSVAEELVSEGGFFEPQTREATTLFTDIVGFSTVSETMTPPDLIELLNEYFAVIVEPIERHGGVIHQFQGDAILATYNLPVAAPDHAARAVRTALAIQEALRDRRFRGGVRLPTRIGINTGTVVCGTVGARGRLGFTVHGDDVNLASRLEQMNKSVGTRVLVAQSTVDRVGAEFVFEQVGEMPVRGRSRPVVVYRVLGSHNVDENVTS
jgi:class 3 adenylate cyclase